MIRRGETGAWRELFRRGESSRTVGQGLPARSAGVSGVHTSALVVDNVTVSGIAVEQEAGGGGRETRKPDLFGERGSSEEVERPPFALVWLSLLSRRALQDIKY